MCKNRVLIGSPLLFQFPMCLKKQNKKTSQQKKNKLTVDTLYNEMRFYRYLSGNIVFLLGTSSSGKSSTVKYIKENSTIPADKLVFTGTDTIYRNLVIDYFLKNSPREMMTLLKQIRDVGKIVECIFDPEKLNISCLELDKITEAQVILVRFNSALGEFLSNVATQYLYYCANLIIPSLAKGKTIIVDTVELYRYIRVLSFYLIQCKIDIVAIYCPPKILEKHIEKRNKIGIKQLNFSEVRFFFPFEQYNEIYVPTSDRINSVKITLLDIQSIDVNAKVASLKPYIIYLQSQDQNNACNRIWQNILSKIDVVMGKQKTTQNISRKQDLIDKWFLSGMNLVYIKTKAPCQMFLNSEILSTVERGKKVLSMIDNHYAECDEEHAMAKPLTRCKIGL